MNNPASKALQALIRTAVVGSAQDQMLAHRDAYQIGAAMVEPIISELRHYDWSRLGQREGMAILTACALLLHDIDEGASRSYVTGLLKNSMVHPVYAQRLKTVIRFTADDYLHTKVEHTSIFTHKTLPAAQGVADTVVSWLKLLPSNDVRDIERLYVIPKIQDRHWGTYLRILSRVVVVWRGQFWLHRLHSQATLFHEVGHHVGHAPDASYFAAELAADRYTYQHLALHQRALAVPGLRNLLCLWLLGRRYRQLHIDK